MDPLREVGKLLNRAGLWETRSKRASLKGDYDRAGELRNKAFQLAAKARRIEEKYREEVNHQ
ncbi:hypothetical protein A3844_28905 [Paenibacillus helianthi]|uniref:Uncharacterized protein n=1 Tax=Paenibacillus helianthi TaxID=1349432 RepID=A0ABX3EGJ5_9BACL|nr:MULTISPECIES: hypothetical protein [Paenibacillus]OKP78735.1 hypothetical protein A3844_28905 [Paenibacillus helianthi]OKP91305.1 hypothetical protein A3848_09360 [Paenibacillus sp. P32E]